MKLIKITRLRFRQLRKLYGSFGELIAHEYRWLGISGVALSAEICFRLLAPWPIKYLFDGLLMPVDGFEPFGLPPGLNQNSPELYVTIVCGALLLFATLAACCGYFRQVWAATAGQRMVVRLRKQLYGHLQLLSLRFHGEQRLGDLMLRITGDIPALRDVLSETLIDAIGRIVLASSMLTILFVLNPTLALVALGSTALVALLSTISTRKVAKVAKRQRIKESIVSHSAAEMLQSLPLIKALGQEETLLKRFARRNRSAMRQGLEATRLQAALSRNVEILFALATGAVLALGVLQVSEATATARGGLVVFTAGDLLVFLSYLRSLNKPLRSISRSSSRVGKASACGERVMEIMAVAPEERDQEGACEASMLLGEIECKDLRFGYQDDSEVLRGLSFCIQPGECVAVVGRNGAGKSTLLHLLLRFYDADSGSLCFDGKRVEEYTIASLRSSIALVLQDGVLFSGTIRSNLELSAPDASEQQMTQALQAAGADFVLDHELGIEFELTEHGQNLSGGERRKLALAAALLRNASILILDEPTTNIDAFTRAELLNRLPQLMAGRSTLLVTHDPELLEVADRIVLIENGRAVCTGTAIELYQSSAEFRTLFPLIKFESERPA